MRPDPKDPPEVIDLRRYRQAAESAKVKAKARPAPKATGDESLLGGRKHAGLILVAFVLVALALWLAPRLL